MTVGGRQDMERHSRPRQMGFQPDREESKETPFQDGRRGPGHEPRRGPMGNNGTNQSGKFSVQEGQGHFRGGPHPARGRMDFGRRGANHDRKLATSPIRSLLSLQNFPQGGQDFPQEHPDFPQGRQEFPRQERQEFPRQERQEFPRQERQEFPRQERQEFPRQERQEFPRQERQEFPRQERQEFPRQERQEFPRQERQEFPRQERQEFPRQERQEFPRQERQEFPRQERQEFPRQERQEFPRQERQEFPRQERQEFPKQGRGRQQFPPGHKVFNQGRQGQACREQREEDCHVEPRQEDPGWGKDPKPLMGRGSMCGGMSRPLDPVAPSRWKNQQESSEVMVVAEETLTIKVDMNRPVSKNR